MGCQQQLHASQARQRHEKTARRHDKVQRIVQACPEVAAASQLRQLCSAVQAHVPDVEQSCIMVQWMMQEVADLGISGVSWTPAKVCDPKSRALALLMHGIAAVCTCPMGHGVWHQDDCAAWWAIMPDAEAWC